MIVHPSPSISSFFFFNDTATTEIYTLSLHDALPICWNENQDLVAQGLSKISAGLFGSFATSASFSRSADRKSTRLNSSHQIISYAVFCLKKKTLQQRIALPTVLKCLRCSARHHTP